MAFGRLTQLSSLINHQVVSHQTLATYFSKIDALLQVAMENEAFSGVVPHDYLWVLSDLVGEARELNEDSLGFLLRVPPDSSVN